MIRALVIGHTYIVAANRRKLALLAEHPDVELALVAPTSWPEPDFGWRHFEPEDRFRSYVFPVRFGGQVRRFVYPLPSLIRTIREVRPDVVQLEAEAGSLCSVQLAGLKKMLSFCMVLFVWDNIASTRWAQRKMTRFVYRATDHLLAGSGQALHVGRLQGYQGPASVLPQIGVDSRIRMGEEGIDPWSDRSGFKVGYVGRLAAHKGVEQLIEALAGIENALLTVVGDGVQRSALEQKARDLGVDQRVAFVGAVPHGKVRAYLRAMDALVLPSVRKPGWSEQFGHVLIEAMAAEVPVVGSRSGVIPEIVGEAGLLFDQCDVKGLAKQIRHLMDQPQSADELRVRGRQRVTERYSDEAIAKATFALWREMGQTR